MNTRLSSASFLTPLLLAGAMFFNNAVYGQIPTVLTDKIHRGSGVIDLLKDMSGSQLGEYLRTYQSMFLAADVNENASGNETSRSMGVALQQMRLLLSTTSGDFSFGDFYTSTSAKILAAGATSAQQFYTLFGSSGSNELTSATKSFDISRFDDVITISNINFTGDILGAKLEIAFVNVATGRGTGANEEFFDFSGGFEDFAILTRRDAAMLEAAAIGQAAAPGNLAVVQNTTPLTPVIRGEIPAEPLPVTPEVKPAEPADGGAVPIDTGVVVADPGAGTPVEEVGGGATEVGDPVEGGGSAVEVGDPTGSGGGVVDAGGTVDAGSDAIGGTAGSGDAIVDGGSGVAVNPVPTAPGAPAPPLVLLLAGAALLALYQWRASRTGLSG